MAGIAIRISRADGLYVTDARLLWVVRFVVRLRLSCCVCAATIGRRLRRWKRMGI